MRLTALLFLLLVVALRAQPSDEAIALRGLLVAASAEPGESDPRLQPYEDPLRRILRFERFQQLGQGRSVVRAPGTATILLGQNHRLQVRLEAVEAERVRLQLEWLAGNNALMRTGLMLRRGVPAILGGPPRGNGEVFAVIVVVD